eukprot:CAMPEP_0170801562 /NCGR_PEP_ID=MMETSP0733-20121128/28633_1 /TAXON_ID=186038 /ORGANISM="Fragilariopsis kerguelensis, Strain L26-C5" /LENGTH=362 /DNA_ID=CAMNT_0011154345 /DNA_START=85 /DNA_END=1175 /DNA_ORIENTATION=+
MSSTTKPPPPPVGDFHKFHRPEAGSRTVEGNTSGQRAMKLERQREEQQEQFEQMKRQRTLDNLNTKLTIGSKFQPARIGSVEEQAFKSKTTGLVSAEDFVAATNEKDRSHLTLGDEDYIMTEEEKIVDKATKLASFKKEEKRAKKKKKDKKKRAALLSFHDEEEDDDDGGGGVLNDTNNKGKNNNKNTTTNKKDPTIDTSFLPDKERELAITTERIRLKKNGNHNKFKSKKKNYKSHIRIGMDQDIVEHDFRELNKVASDGLVYVKEDLILPHDITFYDLIVTKARGKSGPLFHFDVHEDIRVGPQDVRVEKDESHPGKVVERSWYERNKHIFPASRWEVYDPAKNYGGYTIAGKIVTTKNK